MEKNKSKKTVYDLVNEFVFCADSGRPITVEHRESDYYVVGIRVPIKHRGAVYKLVEYIETHYNSVNYQCVQSHHLRDSDNNITHWSVKLAVWQIEDAADEYTPRY